MLAKITENILNTDKDKEIYRLIIELVPMEDIEKYILPKSYDETSESKIEKCKEAIMKNSRKHMKKVFKYMKKAINKKQAEYLIDKFVKLAITIANYAEEIAFQNYIISIGNSSIQVDTYTIDLISKRFKRDIYFIDSKTRMPYIEGRKYSCKGRKSIILLWIEGSHYEIVGRLLPGDRIQREFDFNDPLIERINTFLYKPKSIPNKYPELTPFIPKNIRKELFNQEF